MAKIRYLCNPWASAIPPTRHIYITLTQNYQIIVLTSWGCVTGIKKPHRFKGGAKYYKKYYRGVIAPGSLYILYTPLQNCQEKKKLDRC